MIDNPIRNKYMYYTNFLKIINNYNTFTYFLIEKKLEMYDLEMAVSVLCKTKKIKVDLRKNVQLKCAKKFALQVP